MTEMVRQKWNMQTISSFTTAGGGRERDGERDGKRFMERERNDSHDRDDETGFNDYAYFMTASYAM